MIVNSRVCICDKSTIGSESLDKSLGVKCNNVLGNIITNIVVDNQVIKTVILYLSMYVYISFTH